MQYDETDITVTEEENETPHQHRKRFHHPKLEKGNPVIRADAINAAPPPLKGLLPPASERLTSNHYPHLATFDEYDHVGNKVLKI